MFCLLPGLFVSSIILTKVAYHNSNRSTTRYVPSTPTVNPQESSWRYELGSAPGPVTMERKVALTLPVTSMIILVLVVTTSTDEGGNIPMHKSVTCLKNWDTYMIISVRKNEKKTIAIYIHIYIYIHIGVCVCVVRVSFYFLLLHLTFLFSPSQSIFSVISLCPLKGTFYGRLMEAPLPKNRCLWHVLQNYEKNSSRNWQSEGGKGWLCFWGMNLSDIHFYHPIDFKRWLHFSSTQNPIWTQVFTCSKTLGKVAVLEMHFTILWKKRNQHECWRENKQICYSKVMQMDS